MKLTFQENAPSSSHLSLSAPNSEPPPFVPPGRFHRSRHRPVQRREIFYLCCLKCLTGWETAQGELVLELWTPLSSSRAAGSLCDVSQNCTLEPCMVSLNNVTPRHLITKIRSLSQTLVFLMIFELIS